MIEIMHEPLSHIESLIHESWDYGGCCPHERTSHAGDEHTQNTTTRRHGVSANTNSSPVAPPRVVPKCPNNGTPRRRSPDCVPGSSWEQVGNSSPGYNSKASILRAPRSWANQDNPPAKQRDLHAFHLVTNLSGESISAPILQGRKLRFRERSFLSLRSPGIMGALPPQQIQIQHTGAAVWPASSQVAPKQLGHRPSSEQQPQGRSVTHPRSPSTWQSRGSDPQI